MNLYCNKCSKFTESNNVNIKREIDRKSVLYSRYFNGSMFVIFE